MAIAIEKEKSKANWFGIIIFVLVLAAVIGIAYYLFFAATPFIETIVPTRLKSAGEIAKIEINPQELFDNPVFKNLRQYVNTIEVQPAYNPSPFLLP